MKWCKGIGAISWALTQQERVVLQLYEEQSTNTLDFWRRRRRKWNRICESKMANLSSLVHELRERITASSSSPTPNKADDDDALEVRFRAVLPNLLQTYVVPSSSGMLSLSFSPSLTISFFFYSLFYFALFTAKPKIVGSISSSSVNEPLISNDGWTTYVYTLFRA